MDPPSNYTFVDAGTPSTRQGTARGSNARSIIRSHAMQQVWEQRRQRRDKEQAQSDLEIVLEQETGKKASPSKSAKSKASTASRTTKQSDGREITRGGLTKMPVRRLIRSTTFDDTAKPSSPATNPGRKAPTNRQNSRAVVARPGQSRLRSHSYSGRSHEFWNTNHPAPTTNTIGLPLSDPFNTCAIPMGARDSRYIKHYFEALSWRFTMPKNTWMEYAIRDPGLLHGVLAIAAAHYSFATIGGLSDDASMHHTKTCSHVSRCINLQELRYSDGVIGAIGRMAICHLIFGQRNDFGTHMVALDQSVQVRGGLERLGMTGQLKYVIASCVAGAAPCYWEHVPERLRHPYGVLEYPATRDVDLNEPLDPVWGSGFRDMNRAGYISDKLLDICDAMNALDFTLRTRRASDESQQRDYGEQCNKMSLRLVYLKEYQTASVWEQLSEYMIHECVRLAVYFYLVVFQRDVPLLSVPAISMLRQLGDALNQTDVAGLWGGGQRGELLLWVQLITACGCVRPQERSPAGQQLRMTALRLGVTSWAELKRICSRFLYLESNIERRSWPLWKDYGFLSPEEMSPASLCVST